MKEIAHKHFNRLICKMRVALFFRRAITNFSSHSVPVLGKNMHGCLPETLAHSQWDLCIIFISAVCLSSSFIRHNTEIICDAMEVT